MRNERETAAWKIFNKMFYVAIPNLHLYSEDFIRQVGIHAPDSQMQRDLLNQPRRVSMTLANIINHRENGASVTFLAPSGGKEAFDLITEHLTDWVTIMKGHLNFEKPPLVDLEMMENFAMELYPYIVNRAVQKRNTGTYTLKPRTFMGKTMFKELTLVDESKANAYKRIVPTIANEFRSRYGYLDDPAF